MYLVPMFVVPELAHVVLRRACGFFFFLRVCLSSRAERLRAGRCAGSREVACGVVFPSLTRAANADGRRHLRSSVLPVRSAREGQGAGALTDISHRALFMKDLAVATGLGCAGGLMWKMYVRLCFPSFAWAHVCAGTSTRCPAAPWTFTSSTTRRWRSASSEAWLRLMWLVACGCGRGFSPSHLLLVVPWRGALAARRSGLWHHPPCLVASPPPNSMLSFVKTVTVRFSPLGLGNGTARQYVAVGGPGAGWRALTCCLQGSLAR